eukprot:GHVT01040600.1.p1 GENE.GHVT01040600.1~~GHVT01040600.1.p1  ORF type:complete len:135 (-),score=4.06 GHVT01040600.1:1117-1521(-)
MVYCGRVIILKRRNEKKDQEPDAPENSSNGSTKRVWLFNGAPILSHHSNQRHNDCCTCSFFESFAGKSYTPTWDGSKLKKLWGVEEIISEYFRQESAERENEACLLDAFCCYPKTELLLDGLTTRHYLRTSVMG